MLHVKANMLLTKGASSAAVSARGLGLMTDTICSQTRSASAATCNPDKPKRQMLGGNAARRTPTGAAVGAGGLGRMTDRHHLLTHTQRLRSNLHDVWSSQTPAE
jgi:hypothetical protein